MSFGVFLCPRYRPVKVDHSAKAVHSVKLADPYSVSGQTLHIDQDQITCVGRAHRSTAPETGPQEVGLLINLVAYLINLPDSLVDQSDNILVMTFLPQHFYISNSHEVCIGWPVHDISCETVLSHCTEWAWEASFDREAMFESPFDFLYMQCDATLICTGGVVVRDDSLTVASTLVGDIDGNGSLPKDIADLVYLVEWMFYDSPAPRCSLTADCNGDSLADIAGLGCWVDTISPSG